MAELEARKLKTKGIGTEALLLGILLEGQLNGPSRNVSYFHMHFVHFSKLTKAGFRAGGGKDRSEFLPQ